MSAEPGASPVPDSGAMRDASSVPGASAAPDPSAAPGASPVPGASATPDSSVAPGASLVPGIDAAPELDGWTHVYSGKVRDLYIPATAESIATSTYLLVVASDRISAFDFVLSPPITGKGAVLTALSRWWFAELDVPNHLVDAAGDPAGAPAVPAQVADRAMLTKRLEMYPIECVVRGALTGSGYAEYLATGAVCGIELPAGLRDGDLLDEPIYTPAYKAPLGEHDENITFERSVELVGEAAASAMRDASLRIFSRARELAAERGVLLADTKFEFGADPRSGELTLADEVLTSDSSRYWDAAIYEAGGDGRLASFDKQIVRNWLAANWNKEGEPPVLPEEIVERTLARYRELYDRISGAALAS